MSTVEIGDAGRLLYAVRYAAITGDLPVATAMAWSDGTDWVRNAWKTCRIPAAMLDLLWLVDPPADTAARLKTKNVHSRGPYRHWPTTACQRCCSAIRSVVPIVTLADAVRWATRST